ncbi:ABC transporter ATP-binding protein [Sporomusa sphaeroides DSM 2875]|uniref:ABC transporter ATP-binding protein n=1 Tax=Sporomusa sphaeroides TaxID=47679 RepID=UPI0020304ED9|nr:ABC transporter ATP-binding protein [Sporomusa sphaeroides]MCM0758028.1 ABC transporter ATP-binding protein [Sporomusa sphaeroides DSM 2875]
MDNVVIRVENLSKIYKVYNQPIDRLKESLHPFRKTYHQDFYALKDVSFEINRGETMGIIGKNGSGKSTLLKIISGVLSPTSGSVQVNGKVSALLELGGAFNQEMTGIENIYLNGIIMGYERKQVDELLDDILAFADIGDFIYQPIKVYSSGMLARLAFAVNSHVNPDILIVDEALAVGDMFFKFKCIQKMKKMQEGGTTLLFVSHDLGTVKGFCQRALWLNEGNMIEIGEVDKIAGKYQLQSVEKRQESIAKQIFHEQIDSLKKKNDVFNNAEFEKKASCQRKQNGKARFINIQLLDIDDTILKLVEFGQEVKLRMLVKAEYDINDIVNASYQIRDRNGYDLIYSDLMLENAELTQMIQNNLYQIDWQFKMNLRTGHYNITSVLAIQKKEDSSYVDFCDWVPYALQFEVAQKRGTPVHGVYWENDVQVKQLNFELEGRLLCNP